MPFGLHTFDLIIVLVVALLIFGPKKLPEMGSSIGKSIKEFRKGMAELSHPKEDHEDELKVPNVEVQQRELASQSASVEHQDLQAKPVQSEVSHSEVSTPEATRE
jgi:sec-independent protein translocase protein TatA